MKGSPVVRGVGPLALLTPIILLGLISSVGPWVGIAVASVGVGVATYLREGRTDPPAWTAGPALAGLVIVSSLAPPTFVAEMLATLGALAVLAWLAWPRGSSPDRRIALAVGFPGVCAAIAIAASLVFVAGEAEVGIVAAIMVGVLLFLGWVFEHPTAFRDRSES